MGSGSEDEDDDGPGHPHQGGVSHLGGHGMGPGGPGDSVLGPGDLPLGSDSLKQEDSEDQGKSIYHDYTLIFCFFNPLIFCCAHKINTFLIIYP